MDTLIANYKCTVSPQENQGVFYFCRQSVSSAAKALPLPYLHSLFRPRCYRPPTEICRQSRSECAEPHLDQNGQGRTRRLRLRKWSGSGGRSVSINKRGTSGAPTELHWNNRGGAREQKNAETFKHRHQDRTSRTLPKSPLNEPV